MIIFNENNPTKREKSNLIEQLDSFELDIIELNDAFIQKKNMILEYVQKISNLTVESQKLPVFSIVTDLEEALNIIDLNLSIVSNWKMYVINIRKILDENDININEMKLKIEILNKSIKNKGKVIDDNNVLLDSVIRNYLKNNDLLRDIQLSEEKIIDDTIENAIKHINQIHKNENLKEKILVVEDETDEIINSELDDSFEKNDEETNEIIENKADEVLEKINEETNIEVEEIKEQLENKIEKKIKNKKSRKNAKREKREANKKKEIVISKPLSKEDFDDTYGGILKNNTLVISEKSGKVILPYFISDVKNIITKDYTKSEVENLIDNNYVVPLSNYKNQHISRFKEAYYLYNSVENVPKLQSIKKATNIALNNRLNPAIITACKTRFELDTYMDCLEKDKLEDFNIFDIQYESSPVINNNK